ncbi:hypothetical protein Lal_00043369 [Lupinus albus]|nr:hypothetical protein Lal_00043369 [Lupinus albus]
MEETATEIVGEPLEVTNVAGVSRITRSGRVYGPLDARKVPANTSKGKAKVNVLADEEVEADLEEPVKPEDKGGVSNEEACEFLKFIRQSFASGMIAVVGEVGPGKHTNYVIQCPPGTVLNNWTEEDVSPRVFYENM